MKRKTSQTGLGSETGGWNLVPKQLWDGVWTAPVFPDQPNSLYIDGHLLRARWKGGCKVIVKQVDALSWLAGERECAPERRAQSSQ